MGLSCCENSSHAPDKSCIKHIAKTVSSRYGTDRCVRHNANTNQAPTEPETQDKSGATPSDHHVSHPDLGHDCFQLLVLFAQGLQCSENEPKAKCLMATWIEQPASLLLDRETLNNAPNWWERSTQDTSICKNIDSTISLQKGLEINWHHSIFYHLLPLLQPEYVFEAS